VTAEQLATALFWVNVTASVTILLVFVLRPAVKWAFGARAVYRLWLIVPVVVIASFVPEHEPGTRIVDDAILATGPREPELEGFRETTRSALDAASTWVSTARGSMRPERDTAEVLMTLWLLGALLLFARAVIRSRRVAADPTLGPALVGVFRPRLVLPQDFSTRFNEREQSLVLAHEAAHQASRDPLINALIEVFRCLNWMNPLVHVAAFHARADQEIACDAAVVARFPSERRAYAEALLKTQIARAYPPLGCAWPGRSPSLLRRRIEMLGRRLPGRARAAAGIAAIAALMAGTSYAAWAAQLAQNAPPTSTRATRVALAEPPPGLLTRLEARRHTQFVQRAQAGDIDVVFLGDSMTDFWRYPPERDQWNRTGGRPEWERHYAPLKAVNFGVEGAHTRSVLWRLQNGELDGYRAKVFVLMALGIADVASHGADIAAAAAGNAPIVAEIRKRQPRAKIFVLSIPRGPSSGQPNSELNAALAEGMSKLADGRSVYYVDVGSRFAKPDGSLDPELTYGNTLTLKGYEAWAEALDPKLEESLR
jgi:beta-lactamase regulating signal transducer with metallopeptidase domain